ncbi:MAG TPA: hypothetical protein ENK86_06850 [Campylobacterales bacterium]|nr:hypothetical protein [Campylobacterales bacterium]
MNQLDKLNTLIDQLESKLSHHPTNTLRSTNISSLKALYHALELNDKVKKFDELFEYKAMNLTGISLQDEDFADIRQGRYVQIICISYERNAQGKNVSKNSSLGYFGKAEKLTDLRKREILEFVLRWRYEKAFRHTEVYEALLDKLAQI